MLSYGVSVPNLPVRIDHNINIDARIVNGTKGVLTSIKPQNPETLRNIYGDSNIKAGDIVIIEQPILTTRPFCPQYILGAGWPSG